MGKKLVYLIFLLNVTCEKSSYFNDLRIVSLSPAMTEIIFALGAESHLVGTTTYCDFPDSAKKIYKVGDFSNPTLERIISLKPNLVIVNLPEQSRIKNQLEKYGLKIFVTSPEKLEDIYNEISALGNLIKKQKQADSLINYMKANIKPLFRVKKKVYIELSARPPITIGGKSYLNELIAMAGGENIFSDINKDYPVVNQEEVIMRNPEIIIVLHPEDIKNRIGWNRVNAIKNQRVYRDLNLDWILRPGPRLVLGFEQLEKIFE